LAICTQTEINARNKLQKVLIVPYWQIKRCMIMKNETPEFGIAVASALRKVGLKQYELATRAGLTHPTVTRLIKGRRPSPEILEAICNAFGDPVLEIGILCDHLRDEIKRAGKLTTDIELLPSGSCPKNGLTQLDHDLDTLRSDSDHEDMRDLIHDLAEMVRRHRRQSSTKLMMVAESKPTYQTKNKKPRKSKS
jgi:transcriptional regulator with XRE-family HTH domain